LKITDDCINLDTTERNTKRQDLTSVIQCVKKGGSEAHTQFITYLLYWGHNITSGILQLLQKPTETGR
jgi:hypothetical protein